MAQYPEIQLPYTLARPDALCSAVVFSSPHSGCDYSQAFLRRSRLDSHAIRSSEDAFVDRLLQAAPGQGAPLLSARAPRAFVDLNRGPDELDPAVIEGVRKTGMNPRVSAGLGVIPRVVGAGRAIYSGKIPRAEAEARIAQWWRPYHACLAQLLEEARRDFGHSILIDVHSTPHEALEGIGPRPAQIVLGDRFGVSAGSEVIAQVEAAFLAEGLRVARNVPFAGAYITQAYSLPSRRRHAIQIEIDRALYMDERTLRPNSDFDAFGALMARVIGRLARIGDTMAEPLAAE
jgi:N-formylglutamate amidohydrolase